jgi:hypothetical protein
MNWLFSLYVAVLFFILTPALLLRIPKKGSKYTVAGVHAIVFALLLHFTGKFVWNVSMSMEGFQEGAGAADRGKGVGKTTAPKVSTDTPEEAAKKLAKKQEKVLKKAANQAECVTFKGKDAKYSKDYTDADGTNCFAKQADLDAARTTQSKRNKK